MAARRRPLPIPLADRDPDELVEPPLVCTTLKIKDRTFRKYAAQGRIPVVHVGRQNRVRAGVLVQLARDGVK